MQRPHNILAVYSLRLVDWHLIISPATRIINYGRPTSTDKQSYSLPWRTLSHNDVMMGLVFCYYSSMSSFWSKVEGNIKQDWWIKAGKYGWNILFRWNVIEENRHATEMAYSILFWKAFGPITGSWHYPFLYVQFVHTVGMHHIPVFSIPCLKEIAFWVICLLKHIPDAKAHIVYSLILKRTKWSIQMF